MDVEGLQVKISPMKKKNKTTNQIEGKQDGGEEPMTYKDKQKEKQAGLEKVSKVENGKESNKDSNIKEDKKINNNKVKKFRGITVCDEDVESLEDKKWATCTTLSIFMTVCEEKRREMIEKNRVLLIKPEIAQMFKFGEKTLVKDTKEQWNIKDREWAIFPVSDRTDEMKGDGGVHWSLLIFGKREHKFFHFDPLGGMNTIHARDLIINSADRDSFNEEGNLPRYEEVEWGSQKNGYDCGPFIMHYITMALRKIEEGRVNMLGFGEMYPEEWRANATRKELRIQIEKEIGGGNVGEVEEMKEKEMEIIRNQEYVNEKIVVRNGDKENEKKQEGTKTTVRESYRERGDKQNRSCLLYTSPSPRDLRASRMPSSA